MSMSMTGMNDAAMARSSVEEADLRSRQREVENSRRALNGGAPVDKEKKLREACEGFEAMFIQKMWEGMRSSLPKDGLITGGRDEKTWQGMYDQELGKSMAKSGGIGLADMMMTQLSRNLQNASEVAATSAARREPMAIEPVPLLPPKASTVPSPEAAKAAESTASAKPLASAAGLYGAEAAQPEAPGETDTASLDATAKLQAGATGTPADTPVQSVLQEFATTLVPPAATTQNAVVGVAVPLEPVVQAAPLARQPVATPPKRVRPPRDGMPRVPYRSVSANQPAPDDGRQANMTTGPKVANTRTNPMSGNSASAPAASATNLMKEQMS